MHLPAGTSLNESPSEKEGKLVQDGDFKVSGVTLNESPSEKEGKLGTPYGGVPRSFYPSMKVPPKRKGNTFGLRVGAGPVHPSMKVPPKRKGNVG